MDGKKYCITRDEEEKLRFDEIDRVIDRYHNPKPIDLIELYKTSMITQKDVKEAEKTVNRTEAQREQIHNKAKSNNFEGR